MQAAHRLKSALLTAFICRRSIAEARPRFAGECSYWGRCAGGRAIRRECWDPPHQTSFSARRALLRRLMASTRTPELSSFCNAPMSVCRTMESCSKPCNASSALMRTPGLLSDSAANIPRGALRGPRSACAALRANPCARSNRIAGHSPKRKSARAARRHHPAGPRYSSAPATSIALAPWACANRKASPRRHWRSRRSAVVARSALAWLKPSSQGAARREE